MASPIIQRLICLTGFLAILMATAAEQVTRRGFYCNLKTCDERKHTLCKFPFLQTSEECGRVISAALTAQEIRELLDVHIKNNEYRRLVWDQELADIAQTWADQCSPRVDECRNVERFVVSQSYSYTKTTGNFSTQLSDLVNQKQLRKRYSHVGCGAVRYNPDGKFNTTYLVCNYASAGY